MATKQLWNGQGRGITVSEPDLATGAKATTVFDTGEAQVWNTPDEAKNFLAANDFRLTEKPAPGAVVAPAGVMEWLKANGLMVAPVAAPAPAPAEQKAAA